MSIAIEIVSDITALEPWKEAWESLFAASDHEPSTSYEWTAALLSSHIRQNHRLHLLILKHSGAPAGFVPLVATSDRVLGQSLITVQPVSELYNTHTDFLFRDDVESGIAALLDALQENSIPWDVFRLGRLLEHQPVTESLERQLAARGQTHRSQYTPPSFFLELPASMDEYLAQRSGKFRNYLRRTEKKLAAQGSVEFEVVAADADIEQAYRNVLHVETNSWKHAHGTAISAVPHQTVFYKNLCLGAARTGRLHLSFLHLNGEPVAYNLGYFHNHRYYYLKTSYHEGYRSAGIATYSRARLIEQVIRQGARYFDFPGEPYEWEQQWTSELRWHKSTALFNRTIRGRAFYLLTRLKQRLKGQQGDDKILEFCDARALQPPQE